MMTNMCLIFFMFINDKYMFHVFMHKRKIYLWILDHRRCLSQSWCEYILLWSLVSYNVVVVFVLLWSRRSYELVFCDGLCQVVSFSIWFLLCFFRLCYFTFVFVLFRVNKDGWWLCSTYVIWSENLESDFF